MSQLIALVATAVLVDGVRTVIEPGQPLPELGAHDARALLDSGAAASPADLDAQEAQTAQAVRAAEADFTAARRRAQEEAASIAAPASTHKAGKKPADKPGAKE